MKPIIQITVPFAAPGASWRISVCPVGQTESMGHTQRRENAIADMMRTERRESWRGVCSVLFNLPPTHEFFLERVRRDNPQMIVRIPVRVKGTAINKQSQEKLSEIQQLEKLANFWKVLLVNDGLIRDDTWEFVQPGYDAYLFWSNALVSQYVAFFGDREHPERRTVNSIRMPRP